MLFIFLVHAMVDVYRRMSLNSSLFPLCCMDIVNIWFIAFPTLLKKCYHIKQVKHTNNL